MTGTRVRVIDHVSGYGRGLESLAREGKSPVPGLESPVLEVKSLAIGLQPLAIGL
jgi:hypothetical protein